MDSYGKRWRSSWSNAAFRFFTSVLDIDTERTYDKILSMSVYLMSLFGIPMRLLAAVSLVLGYV